MTDSGASRLRTLISGFAAVAIAASLLTPTSSDSAAASQQHSATSATASASAMPPVDTSIRKTADLSQFRAGNIISDAVFFNSGSMSAGQIDAFFRAKAGRCQTGYTCLKDYRQSTPDRAADAYCNGYKGAGSESAATIIYKVAQSCGINPQVLVVMLQKEQSLITHTSPSATRYSRALGQGCPDTAPCDPRYAGFFYQIYGAARQMQIYAEGRWFTYYAPGKTWNILYHPEASRGCGRAPVYIENKATAALYYYTPYQPNRAALNAGYGEGDRCSSYGNRNFYQYFTDWFGSTQTSPNPLVLGAGQDDVYLISGGVKHHVVTPEDLTTLGSRLGGISHMPASYVDNIPTGSPITRYVHDTRSGTLYILDPDGTKHRFTSADQVSRFGYAFNSYVNLDSAILDRFTTGADITDFFRVWNEPATYLYENGKRRHITTGQAWQSISAGTSGYVAYMPSTTARAIPLGAAIFAPNQLVRPASSGDVYLATASGSLLHIPSFALAAEFGAVNYAIIADDALSATPRLEGSLTPIVTCGSASLVAAGGQLHSVSGTDFGSLRPIKLSASDCGNFRISSSKYATPLFFQAIGSPEVYALNEGKLRHVSSYKLLQSLNGPRPLSIINWSAATVKDIGLVAPYLEEGGFVQFAGRPEVYQHSNGVLRHVLDYTTLLRLNGGRTPSISVIDATWINGYTTGAPILGNGSFAQFQGSPEVYIHTDAQLRHVQSYASLIRLGNGQLPPIVKLAADAKSAYSIGSPIP